MGEKAINESLLTKETDAERLKIFEKSLTTLREMLKIQCNDGNWNYDPYMHGMANGMIFALALFDNMAPKYLEAPSVWLCDIKSTVEPVSCREAQ